MQQSGDEAMSCSGLDDRGKNKKKWPQHDKIINR